MNTLLFLFSRVVLNDTKDKAFFTIYKGGCLPYLDKILAKKENEKWHFQEIIKEKYD
ncbi:hypothetical protein FLJU110815_08740 [Flavobacterium jumunjinense]